MKNKMMKTAGLLLASTTMLMANGVVASESIQDKPCEAEVLEDGQTIKFMINFGVAIITAGKIDEAFNFETKCKSKAVVSGYTYPINITSVTGSNNSHSFANDISDNSEVTTFTSQDGTLEIKVTERDKVKEPKKIEYIDDSKIVLAFSASEISSSKRIQQMIEQPIVLSLYDPEKTIGSISLIESEKHIDGSATMSLRIIGPDFFSKKTDGGELTDKEFNLMKDMLGFIPANRFASTNGFNEITEYGLNTFAGMVMHKLDVDLGIQISDTVNFTDSLDITSIINDLKK